MSLFVSISSLSGNGVESALMEGMAAENPLEAEKTSLGEAMPGDGLGHIVRTRRMEPTVLSEERGQGRLIHPDEEEGRGFHLSDRERLAASTALRYSSRSDTQGASGIDLRAMTRISRGRTIKDLFLLKRSLALRRALFLSTAPPTFRLATAAILEYSSLPGRKTRVKYRPRWL
jgi:hypothetical protein